MRGKGARVKVLPLMIGITPAYAGKSAAFPCKIPPFWDPPRLCGEKQSSAVMPCTQVGSPPPMRGKVLPPLIQRVLLCSLGSPPPMRGKEALYSAVQRGDRITPAYAGKRNWLRFCEAQNKDHPRLCGEKESSLTVVKK